MLYYSENTHSTQVEKRADMMSQFLNDPLAFLLLAIPLLAALTLHEFSHAWLADYFGDPTPRAYGRVSLNPLAHLDLFGTIALFLIGFGWAKPVPIDSRNFRSRGDEVLVALAGPFMNLTLAVIVGVLLRLVPISTTLFDYAALFVFINVNLMVFNLIPIPPLDGSRLLHLFLPPSTFLRLEQIGSLILLGLIVLSLLGNLSIFDSLFRTTTVPLTNLILGSPIF